MGKQRKPYQVPAPPTGRTVISSDERLVRERLSESGIGNISKEQVSRIAQKGGIARINPKTGKEEVFTLSDIPVSKESAKQGFVSPYKPAEIENGIDLFMSGLQNVGTDTIAGIRQIIAGNDRQQIDAVRKWQESSAAPISVGAKRIMSREEMTPEKFWMTAGSTVGQIGIGLAAGTAATLTGGGAIAALGASAVTQFPLQYNSMLNSALDAGLDTGDAMGYAYGTAAVMSAIEALPIGKIIGGATRAISPTITKKVIGGLASKYGVKSANELIERIGADKFNQEAAVGVFKSAKNSIADRFIGKLGGITVDAGFEGGTEGLQTYLEKVAEATYDNYGGKGKKKGQGAFGTTYDDVFSKETNTEAFWSGVFGIMGGGFAGSLAAVSSPLYKTGVYDTIDTFVKKGQTVEDAVNRLGGIIDARVQKGELTQEIADNAKGAIQNVATAYTKIGGTIDEPAFRYVVYNRVSEKDTLGRELQDLQTKKQEIEGIIARNEGDADIYAVDLQELDSLINKKQAQLDFTSGWLKEHTQKFYDNKKAKNLSRQSLADESASDFIVDVQNFDKKKQDPIEFAKQADLKYQMGIQEIENSFDAEIKALDLSALDENIDPNFDPVNEFTTKVKLNQGIDMGDGTVSKNFADVEIVQNEDGEFAVARTTKNEDGTESKTYVRVANTPQYQPIIERMQKFIDNQDGFEGIAGKLFAGTQLSEDEQKVYDEFDEHIDGIVETNKREANFNAKKALMSNTMSPVVSALENIKPTIDKYREEIQRIDESLELDENIPKTNKDLGSNIPNPKLIPSQRKRLGEARASLQAVVERYDNEVAKVADLIIEDSTDDLSVNETTLYLQMKSEVDTLFNQMVEEFKKDPNAKLETFYGKNGEYGFLSTLEEYAKGLAEQRKLTESTYNPKLQKEIQDIINKAQVISQKVEAVRAKIQESIDREAQVRKDKEQKEAAIKYIKEAQKLESDAKKPFNAAFKELQAINEKIEKKRANFAKKEAELAEKETVTSKSAGTKGARIILDRLGDEIEKLTEKIRLANIKIKKKRDTFTKKQAQVLKKEKSFPDLQETKDARVALDKFGIEIYNLDKEIEITSERLQRKKDSFVKKEAEILEKESSAPELKGTKDARAALEKLGEEIDNLNSERDSIIEKLDKAKEELEKVTSETTKGLREAQDTIKRIEQKRNGKQGEVQNNVPTESTETTSGVQSVSTTPSGVQPVATETNEATVPTGETTNERTDTTVTPTDETGGIIESQSGDVRNQEGGDTQTQLPLSDVDVEASPADEVVDTPTLDPEVQTIIEQQDSFEEVEIEPITVDNMTDKEIESKKEELDKELEKNLSPETKEVINEQIEQLDQQQTINDIDNEKDVTDPETGDQETESSLEKKEPIGRTYQNNNKDALIKVGYNPKASGLKAAIKKALGAEGDTVTDEDIKLFMDGLDGDERTKIISQLSQSGLSDISFVLSAKPYSLSLTMPINDFLSAFPLVGQNKAASRKQLSNIGIEEKVVKEGEVRIPKGTNVKITYSVGVISGISTVKLNSPLIVGEGKTGVAILPNSQRIDKSAIVEIVNQDNGEVLYSVENPIQQQIIDAKANGSFMYDKSGKVFFNRFAAGLERAFSGLNIGILTEQEWVEAGLPPSSRGAFNRKTNQVMLRAEMFDGGTFVHEAGHAVMQAIQQTSPDLFNRILDTVEGTKYESYVRDNYPNLTSREDILSEAMGYAIQDKGVKMQSRPLAAFRDLIAKAFNAIKKAIGMRGSKSIEDMTLDEFTSELAGVVFGIKDADTFLDQYDIEDGLMLDMGLEVTGEEIQYQYFNFKRTESNMRKGIMSGLEYERFGDKITNRETTLEETINVFKSIFDSPIIPEKIASSLIVKVDGEDFDGYSFASNNIEAFATDYFNYMQGGEFNRVTDLNTGLIDKIGETLLKEYGEQHRESHILVYEEGQQVEAFVDGRAIGKEVLTNVSKVVNAGDTNSASGLRRRMLGRFFASNFFGNISNMETITQLAGGDNSVLRGLQDLIKYRNKLAAAIYLRVTDGRNKLLETLSSISKERDGSLGPLEDEVTLNYYNNVDGNPTLETHNFSVKDLITMYFVKETQKASDLQRRLKKDADAQIDPMASSLAYNPDAKVGAQGSSALFEGGKSNPRGWYRQYDDKVRNVLLTQEQMKALDKLFQENGKYHKEFLAIDAFFKSPAVKEMIRESNAVKYRTEGQVAEEVAGVYFPITPRRLKQVANVNVDSNINNLRFVTDRASISASVQGLDVLSVIEEYIQQNNEYIANADYRNGLRNYLNAVTPNTATKEVNVSDAVGGVVKGMTAMIDNIDTGLKDRREANKDIEKMGMSHRIYSTLLSNFSRGVFLFNIGTIAKQFMTTYAGIGQGVVADKYIWKETKYIASMFGDSFKGYVWRGGNSYVLENGGIGRKKFDILSVKGFDRELEYLKKFPDEFADLIRRVEDPATYTSDIDLKKMDSLYKTKGKLGKVYKAAIDQMDRGLEPMKVNDAAVIFAFVRAARAETADLIKEGKFFDTEGNPVTDIESPYAVRRISEKASELVYKTNNMYMDNDKTLLQRSPSLLHKSIGLFTSQPQKISNLYAQNFISAAQADFGDKMKNKRARNTFVFAIFANALAMAAIDISYGIMKNGYDEEKEYEEDFAYAMARNLLGMLPSLQTEVLSGLMSAIDNASWTGDVGSNPVFDLLSKAIRAVSALHDSMDEEKPEYLREKDFRNGVREGTDAFAKMTGSPAVLLSLISKEFTQYEKKESSSVTFR